LETFWFIALSFMIIIYVILDGFDLGTGIFFLRASKNDTERRTLLNAIGPVWDGNEVWLIAAGGTLFFAFPILYAASFSGFYLPLMLVLWLLIGRALGIELRKHVDNGLWKSFWDVVFSASSILLVVIFGAALGNIIRGVPLEANGEFFEPLWTTFTVVPESGILDWFTVLMSLVAVITLSAHGANYIAVKTEGELQSKARELSKKMNPAILIISAVMFFSTTAIRPGLWDNYLSEYWGFVFPAAGLMGIAGMFYYRIRQNDLKAFISSGLFIFGMLAGTAYGLYPDLMPSSLDPQYSLNIYNSNTGDYGMQAGLYWWIPGFIIVVVYFIYMYSLFKGKVKVSGEGEGY